tara:strand:+ start:527 stop:1063 length:537 start_codon:yes stop_codon:yes gene_type:complete
MTTNYKKGQLILHPNRPEWGTGVVIKDSSGSLLNVSFEIAGTKVLSLEYVEPEIVESSPISEVEFKRRVEKNRTYVDEPFIDIYQDLKSKYPEHVVIIENGAYYDVLDKDALFFQKEFKYKIYDHAIDVMGAGFPTQGLSKILEKLKDLQSSYIVVRQLPNPSQGKIQRKVSEIFPIE